MDEAIDGGVGDGGAGGGGTTAGGTDPDLDLDLLASSLRADGGDVRFLLKALVGRLSDALGDRLEVERAGGRLFRRSDEIRRVSVRLGDDQLEAVVDHGGLVCTVGRSSGGIRIRSTKVTVDEWLRQLLTTLRQEAASSQATRLALESMVIGNQVIGATQAPTPIDGSISGQSAAIGEGGNR